MPLRDRIASKSVKLMMLKRLFLGGNTVLIFVVFVFHAFDHLELAM